MLLSNAQIPLKVDELETEVGKKMSDACPFPSQPFTVKGTQAGRTLTSRGSVPLGSPWRLTQPQSLRHAGPLQNMKVVWENGKHFRLPALSTHPGITGRPRAGSARPAGEGGAGAGAGLERGRPLLPAPPAPVRRKRRRASGRVLACKAASSAGPPPVPPASPQPRSGI